MFNYKGATLFLILVLILIALSGLITSIPIWLFLVPVVPYIILVIYGSATVSSQFFMPVVYRGEQEKKTVAITFDDGPSPATTPAILDILKKNEVPAAFFCIGEKVVENPEIVQRIAGDGHVMGNHSYTHHFLFDIFGHDSMVREMRTTNKAIEKITRKRIHLFRPPYGVTTPVLARAVKKAKMNAVGWSLRSMDTVTKDPKKLVNKITKQVKAGDVILLHDTMPVTVEALQGIIDAIRAKGYDIVPADKLLNINAYV